MKVLLLGEFSGFNQNLKKGLLEIGADVTLASNGDGIKNMPGADMPLYYNGKCAPPLRIFRKHIKPILDLNKFSGYDVAQLINVNLFKYTINKAMIKGIKSRNDRIFLNLTGDCYSLYKTWRSGILGYYTYDDNPGACKRYTSDKAKYRIPRDNEEHINAMMDGIFPTTYEYALGIRHLRNCRKTISFPFDAKSVDYKENKPGNKLVIYHGVIRAADKGSDHILKALKMLEERYPGDVEIIVREMMEYREYLEVLGRTNVLIDACKEHCWGYNAINGMAMGKIVLSGASKKSLNEYGLEKTPILHIKPDADQIFKQLEYVLEHKNEITRWGYESRKFVEDFHSHIRIAEEYMKEWKL